MGRLRDAFREGLRGILLRWGYRVSKPETIPLLEPMLLTLMSRRQGLFIVQVGANDGKSWDPIHNFVTTHHDRLKALVLEPLPDIFEQLRRNYAKYPNVTPVNAAVHNTEKEMTLWRVDPAALKRLPDWARGTGAFNRQGLLDLGIPEDAIVPAKVRCISLADLVDEHRVERVDLLQIDTEGYDAEIILGLDFRRLRPSLIRFEHRLAQGLMSREAFKQVCCALHDNGYELCVGAHDALAYEREMFPEFR